MAIKISGTTIVNDSRVVENADKIGIGRTTPRYDLEILSDAVPTGIAVSVTSTQLTDTNKGLTIFNNGQTPTFTVSYKGRVDAEEYHGTFKGTIDTGVAIDKADKADTIDITDDTTGSGTHYIHFGSETSSYDGVEVDSTGLVYKDGKFGIGENDPASTLVVRKDNQGGRGGELSIVNYASGGSDGIGNEAALNFGLENSTYDADNGNAQIKAVTTAETNATDIVFSNWSGSSFEQRMVITSDGKIGMGGITSPRSILDLGNGSGDGVLSTTLSQYQLMLEAPQTTGDYGRNIGWSVGTNGLVAAINAVDDGTNDSTGLVFVTGNTSSVAERLRIDKDGNVGINTTDPRFNQENASSGIKVNDAKLGVQGSIVIGNLSETSTDVRELAFYRRGGVAAGSPIDDHKMGRIAWYGSSNDTALPDKAWSIEVTPDGGGWSDINNRKGFLSFVNYDSTEALRITSGGKIEVKGTRDGVLQANDDDALKLFTKSTSDDINRGTGITFYTHDGSGYEMGGTIQVAKENGTTDDAKSYMRFSTQDGSTTAERLRITSEGHLKPGSNEAYDIGTDSSNRFRTVYAQTFNGAFQGTADVAAKIDVTDETVDTNNFLVFTNGATGNQSTHTNANLTFNASTGQLTATSFSGGLPITDGANNRIITATSDSAIKGESDLTFDGTDLSVPSKIKHLGDTNTLIEFETDTINFDTDGSERLRIDSNGNIGLNCVPPLSGSEGSLYSTVDHFLVIGDSDTGIAQDGDGQFEIWANNQEIVNFSTAGIDPKKSILPSGAINIGSDTTKISHGYFTNITADSITADITGSASLLDVAADTTDTDGYVLFSNATGADQSIKTNDDIRYDASKGILNLNKTDGGIKFGPGTATNDDAHIEWRGGNNAGYLRISISDDSDDTGANEHIEIGDYSLQGGSHTSNQTFTQHVRIARNQFLVRTGSNTITTSDRLKIDVNGNIGVNADPSTDSTAGSLYSTVDHFIAIGDSDTGIAQDGDGQLELWANNEEIVNFNTTQITPTKSIIPSVTDGSLNLGSTTNKWGTIYAETIDGTISGTISNATNAVNATNAANVEVTQRDTNAAHYLTFVSSDPSGTNLSLYGDNDLQFNPDTNRLSAAQMKPGGIVDSSDGTGTANYYIKANGSGGWSWSQVTGNTGLDVSFLDLNDTPDAFTANKIVKVNGTGTELIFADDNNTQVTYELKATKDADGGSTGTAADPYLFLDASDGNDDAVQLVGSGGVSVTWNNEGKLTIDGASAGSNTTYELKCTKDSDGGDTGTNTDPYLFLDASSGTDDAVQLVGSGGVSVTRNNDGKLTIDGASAGSNTEYDLEGGGTNGTDFGSGTGKIILKPSTGSDDEVSIIAGTNVKIDGTGTTGFTISAKDTNTNTQVTYQLKATKDADGGSTGNDFDPYLFLDASDGNDDAVQIKGTGNITAVRQNDGEIDLNGSVYELTVPESTTKIKYNKTNGLGGSSSEVEIAGGGDVTVTRTNANKLTISSSSSGITNVEVKQYSDNESTRTERTCKKPIGVVVDSGTATIGIGTTSNAYGARFIQSDDPTTSDGGNYTACDGDIWYNTTEDSSSQGATSSDTIEATKFFQNPTSLTETTTFPASGTRNGGVFGPYTIANGVTLTINAGSTFIIL